MRNKIPKKFLVYDTDADAFTDILAKCDAKPWNFDKGGEKENDVNNPNAVKIAFKTNLSEDELEYIVYYLKFVLFLEIFLVQLAMNFLISLKGLMLDMN